MCKKFMSFPWNDMKKMSLRILVKTVLVYIEMYILGYKMLISRRKNICCFLYQGKHMHLIAYVHIMTAPKLGLNVLEARRGKSTDAAYSKVIYCYYHSNMSSFCFIFILSYCKQAYLCKSGWYTNWVALTIPSEYLALSLWLFLFKLYPIIS